ncbi:hypothetical protein EIP86_001547 [Pleurotus ostreatoroseus]|nr:hypothetical protein EIP86_001547 [Pleurotus ostreatoroseus]
MATTTNPQLSNAVSKLSIDDEDNELIYELVEISRKSPKLVRSTEYAVPADPDVKIASWKMNEFKYYDIPSPFPTLARGLFTRETTENGRTTYKIVARGYDKFFNIGEVPWTTWDALEAHTSPPYTLTLKANGCIIFIAALSPTQLIVTSKHALGAIKGPDSESHSQVGERWLRKHLESVGKTEEQLAATLWAKKWTAVAELCDDSFEEHVLPISKDNTGLHLHGLNECSKYFKTMLPDVVDAFAREWGFIPTPYTELKTIPEVKEFTERIGKEGKWRGEPLEGFVVRTHVSKPPTDGRKSAGQSPYAPGSSFFFKVKFDEPYMMYRDWREVTRTLLSKGPSMSNVPKSKLRRPETKAYATWVIGEIKRDRSQFDSFAKGKGIIATRERFLKWFESEQGRDEFAREEKAAEKKQEEAQKQFGKTIIVPVAIPGVGKTTVAVALAHLFGFGHTQSDDIKVKKAAPQFIKNVVQLLKTHDVVIADKNNHLRQHRQALKDAVKDFSPPVRLMALYWSFDLPLATIHRICGDRVLARGDKHQTLHADAVGKSHEEVLWMFLQQSEELNEDEVDVSVDMNVEEPLEDALARAVDACVRILGVSRPSVEQMGAALAAARAYEPKTTDGGKAKPKVTAPRYYALLPELDLEENLDQRFAEADAPAKGVAFYKDLKSKKRVTDRPHITLVHEKGLPADQALWDRCKSIFNLPTPPVFGLKLGHVVWNDRVMALTVTDLSVSSDSENPDAKGVEFVVQLPAELKERLHVTVGTGDASILPVEAKDLVAHWKKGEPGIWSCPLKDTWVTGRIKGLYK